MRQRRFMTIAIAAAASAVVAIAAASAADEVVVAKKKKRAAAPRQTVGVLDAGGGYFYGPYYGRPTYRSYWSGPTTGVYAPEGANCVVPRAHPTWWSFGDWYWTLENVC